MNDEPQGTARTLHNIKCQYGKDWDVLEAEIRANERAKCEEHLICPMCKEHICKHSKPKMVEHQEKLIKEAYVKGVRDNQHAHEQQKLEWFNDGKKQGQANLIGKAIFAIWAHPNFTGTKDDAEEIMAMASESLGKRITQSDKGADTIPKAGNSRSVKPEKPNEIKECRTKGCHAIFLYPDGYCAEHHKPEKPRLDLCKKCWQMTNHSYNEETGELTCLKCKPKTCLNPRGGRELKSSGIYPKKVKR